MKIIQYKLSWSSRVTEGGLQVAHRGFWKGIDSMTLLPPASSVTRLIL